MILDKSNINLDINKRCKTCHEVHPIYYYYVRMYNKIPIYDTINKRELIYLQTKYVHYDECMICFYSKNGFGRHELTNYLDN